MGAVGLGGIFLAINTHDLLRYGKYHPWMALFAPPLLFAGLAGLLYPSATLELKPAPGETGQRSSRAARTIVAAGAVGLLVGGYLVYDPGAIFRWIGPK